METEYQIKESEVPSNIRAILNKEFTDYEIEGAEIAETSAGLSMSLKLNKEKKNLKW